jgi:hypothetical protein
MHVGVSIVPGEHSLSSQRAALKLTQNIFPIPTNQISQSYHTGDVAISQDTRGLRSSRDAATTAGRPIEAEEEEASACLVPLPPPAAGGSSGSELDRVRVGVSGVIHMEGVYHNRGLELVVLYLIDAFECPPPHTIPGLPWWQGQKQTWWGDWTWRSEAKGQQQR